MKAFQKISLECQTVKYTAFMHTACKASP